MSLEQIIQKLETSSGGPEEIIETIRRALDLKYLSYCAVTFPRPDGYEQPIFVSNYPDEWQKRYQEKDYINKDPAVTGALLSIEPLDWTQVEKEDDFSKIFFGEAKEFGISNTGLTIPVRGFKGEVAVITAASDFSLRTWEDYKAENITKIEMASALIHKKILELHGIEEKRPKLSRREIECLYWTSHGKSCADVAGILNIAENTARSYLTSARSKLNCVTITHCVAKAISLRIIPPVT